MEWLTLKEAAALLEVSAATLKSWAASGKCLARKQRLAARDGRQVEHWLVEISSARRLLSRHGTVYDEDGNEIELDGLLTLREAAERYRLPEASLYRWVDRKRLRAYRQATRHGWKFLVHPADLEAVLAETVNGRLRPKSRRKNLDFEEEREAELRAQRCRDDEEYLAWVRERWARSHMRILSDGRIAIDAAYL